MSGIQGVICAKAKVSNHSVQCSGDIGIAVADKRRVNAFLKHRTKLWTPRGKPITTRCREIQEADDKAWGRVAEYWLTWYLIN